jgi:hypothetical protein
VIGLNIEFARWRFKQASRARAAARAVATEQPAHD